MGQTHMKDERRKTDYDYVEALQEIAELGLSDLPRDELIQSLLEKITRAHDADSGAILLYNEDEDILRTVALVGLERAAPDDKGFRPGQSISGKVLAERRSILVEDISSSPLFVHECLKIEGVKRLVAIPLKAGIKTIGVGLLHYKSMREVDESEISIMELMASKVAQVIERAQLLDTERERTEELAQANEANLKMMKELEVAQESNLEASKMAAIGQLAGGVAHEINNPLASILGFAQLSRQKLASSHDRPLDSQDMANLERYLSYIDAEAKRCGEIVNKLLSFSSYSVEDMEPVDLNQLLEEAVRITTNQAGVSDTSLEMKLTDGLPLIPGDSADLVQAFTNLITNAIKAMAHGGTLTVTSRLAEQKAGDEPPIVEVLFEDTGVGIPKENLSKIFEPFFTTSEPGGGMGLGLYVCYQVMKQHSGELRVSSQAGQGTTFTVRLPDSRVPEVVPSIDD